MSEESRPLAGLPPADRTLLMWSPLEVAIAEVRLTPTLTEVTPEQGLQLRSRLGELGHRFARLDRAQEERVSIKLEAGLAPAPNVESIVSGWRLVSSDGRVQVTVMPSALVVQTQAYERWSVSLRPLVEALVTVARGVMGSTVVQRIGLRYVNRFVDPEAMTPAAWKARIDDRLLGPVCHPVFGDRVRAGRQQVELALGDVQGALIRHGPFEDGTVGRAVSYLLDIDVFDAEPLPFDANVVTERGEVLNRTAASLFQSALTPVYLKDLQQPSGSADSPKEVMG